MILKWNINSFSGPIVIYLPAVRGRVAGALPAVVTVKTLVGGEQQTAWLVDGVIHIHG